MAIATFSGHEVSEGGNTYRSVKTGNFSLLIFVDTPIQSLSESVLMIEALTEDLEDDVEGVFPTFSGTGQYYNMDFVLPAAKAGKFKVVSPEGSMVTLEDGSTIVGFTIGNTNEVIVEYDTITDVDVEFCNVRREGNLAIIDIVFGEDILYFDKTDFEIKWLLGTPLYDLEYYLIERLTSQGDSDGIFELVFEIPDGVYGAFSVDLVGYVFKTGERIRENIHSTPTLVYYDTRLN